MQHEYSAMIGVDILLSCHQCGVTIDQNDLDKLDWYWPVYINQGPRRVLQTQLCPKCAPRFSLGRALRRFGNRWPRWVHRLYAKTQGYFWLPCPLCSKMFGSHERSGIIWEEDREDLPRYGRSTCGCNLLPVSRETEGNA